jgi:hypothetical protein
MKARQGRRNLLCCPVDVEIHDFYRGPSMGNRPDVSGNKFLDKVASTENSTGKVECTFTIPDSRRSVIV